jgi:hypothetical protein
MCYHSEADCLPPRLCVTSKLPWKSFLLVLLLFLAILPDFPKASLSRTNLHDTKITTNMIVRLMWIFVWKEQNCTLYGQHKNSRKLSKTQKPYGKTQKPTKFRWVFGFLTSPGPLQKIIACPN